MKYKDYEAIVKYSDEDQTFVGEVVNTRDILVFDGQNVKEIERSFHAVVDEYLKDCADEGREPEKPFSGQFIVRINPKLHRALYIKAKQSNKSLNAFVKAQLESSIWRNILTAGRGENLKTIEQDWQDRKINPRLVLVAQPFQTVPSCIQLELS